MRRRNRIPQPLERSPHPDAGTEIKLQQILSLRRAAVRNETLLDQYSADIAMMNAYVSKHPTFDGHAIRARQAEHLNGEIARLNAENRELHDRIAELSAKLDDADLAFLEPEVRRG